LSNFAFLQTEWPDVYRSARRVEEYVQSDPRSACFHARRALELAVHWLYDHDRAFRGPYSDNLAALLNDGSFQTNVPAVVITKAHVIRKEGNQAVHSPKAVSAQTALGVALELHHVLYWLARTYTKGDPATIPGMFDEHLLPPPAADVVKQSITQLRALDAKLQESDEALRQQKATNAQLQQQLMQLQAQIAAQKAANQAIPDKHDYSEAETRQRIIDVMLREAGWEPGGPDVAEYAVKGMPSNSGLGKVDYVLWGDDGKPLALVEAKRTGVDADRGKQQAKLYADCLEQMHGQRPIIVYTNGFQTWLWDDQRYPPRIVQGFYAKDELKWLIQRRKAAEPLHNIPINSAMVNRPYQHQAIRQMTEHLARSYRKGLLVMATGTGKTRVAIALVDVLMRAGWIKRVLFLADRSALVQQTTRAFKTHLPSSNPVNLTDADGKTQAAAARIVISTYQTMMNVIDEANADGQKLFSVGHFDLIIIDEAHRSVYQKFGAIFSYFDSLLIGLTATPKDEVDRNTYRLFGLDDGVPTFAYHMDQAVPDGYLVPYQAYELPTKFIREGIRYNDLSDEEKLEWELLDWGDSEQIPDSVAPAAINAWLFNKDTVDRILKAVMEHGLKVAGGDRLGKTIIFAKNHKHAKYIAERFDANYPHLTGHFARLVDYEESKVQSLIDDFSKPNNMPHIAISVDMLDTGVDIPEVVNLVFFKVVRSKTKFFQMIGRGTRLRPDLFGPGEDKTHFLIFDACMNFEFFNLNPQGFTGRQAEPLGQAIFKKRLELWEHTHRLAAQDPTMIPLATTLADALHQCVVAMNVDNFIVRPQRQYVEPFQSRQRWETLSRTDIAQLMQYVSGLPTQLTDDDETAKRFDLVMLQLQLAHLQHAPVFARLREAVVEIAADLETKTRIPAIKAELAFIQKVQTEAFWESITLSALENVRTRLRDLVRHTERTKRNQMYTTFTDAGGTLKETSLPYMITGVNQAQYRKKVEQFLHEHEHHWAIRKIRSGTPLKPHDLQSLEQFFYEADAIGGQTKFVEVYGQQHNVAMFIRSLVGLDRKAAKEKFAEFLDSKTFTADQILFVNHIIDHLTANGTIEPGLLYSQPFTDIHYQGLEGLFTSAQASALLGVIDQVNTVVGI